MTEIEPLDDTVWRQNLFPGLKVTPIHELAAREYGEER